MGEPVPYRLMNGMEPLRTSPYEIQLQRGSAATATPNSPDLMELTASYTLDIRNIGAGGRDYSSPVEEGWHYVWLLYSTTTAETAAVISKAELGGDLIIPTGFNRIRKLNSFAFYFSTTTGIRRYVFSNWPNPTIYNTEAANDATYQALDGNATAWTRFTLVPLIAPSARIARIQAHVTSIGDGSGGTCYVRTPGLGTGLAVGTVSSQVPVRQEAVVELAVSSLGEIEYRCSSPNANLELFVLGFNIQETY